MCMVLISDMVDIKTCNPHTKPLWGPLSESGPEIRDAEKAALGHAGPPLSLGLGTAKSCLPMCSLHLSAAAPCEASEGRVGCPARVSGGSVKLCSLAAGFQAFEVQLVLRKALPDIWTVLRDQGVSSHLEGPVPGETPSFLSPLAKSGLCERLLPPAPSLLTRGTARMLHAKSLQSCLTL